MKFCGYSLAILFLLSLIQPGLAQEKLDYEKLWSDLEKSEPASTVALLKMAEFPDATTKFLKTKLHPLILEEEQFAALMKQLGSEDEKIWKKAFNDLEYLDPRILIGLEDLMDKFDKNPTRSRLVELLCDRNPGSLKGKDIKLRKTGGDSYNFSADNGSWWAEAKVERLNANSYILKKKWRRATRAVILLEHFGTRDSMRVLLRLSSGHEKAQPTRVAKAAAKRLKVKLKGN